MNAISEFERLVKLRPDPGFWETNIIDSHILCKSEADHRVFYSFLCTPPDQFDPEQAKHGRTLGDCMDEPTFTSGIQELHPDLIQEIYQNGNETTIRTRRRTPEDSDDEKSPIPDQVSLDSTK
jgi:hypothetical protein